MKEFVGMLGQIAREENESEFIHSLEESIGRSGEYIDMAISYDLESLMAVLEDLAEGKEKRSVSYPTMAFLAHLLSNGVIEKPSVKEAKKKFGATASILLDKVKETVFKSCARPIEEGKAEGTLGRKLDVVYGPLFLLLARGGGGGRYPVEGDDTRWIFTTNWDPCLQEWIRYRNETLHDGVVLDRQKIPVLDVRSGWPTPSGGGVGGFRVVPLHGSVNFVKERKLAVGGGQSEDIRKISPEYMKDSKEFKNLFMIYPLEAIGYENAIRSPYIDMLNVLRGVLKYEHTVYVTGFSFRDPTIASVFDDALREKQREGAWTPLEGDAEERVKMASESKTFFKIIVIDPKPEAVLKNVERQGFFNLYRAIVPIEGGMPPVDSPDFNTKYTELLAKIGGILQRLFGKDMKTLYKIINEEFRLNLQAEVL